jgi:hypothetical protein
MIRDNALAVAEHRARMAAHEATLEWFDCLDPDCSKRSEVEHCLCGYCERNLHKLCKEIDSLVVWLNIMGEIEARGIGGESGGHASNGEATNLTPASLLADELEALAKRFARYAMEEMIKPPTWHDYPGDYLATCSPFLAKQFWTLYLLKGGLLAEPFRGLRQLFAEARLKYPRPHQAQRPRPLPISCPGCGSRTLDLHPITYFRQPFAIVCNFADDDGACGWHCRADAQTFLHQCAVLEQIAKEEGALMQCQRLECSNIFAKLPTGKLRFTCSPRCEAKFFWRIENGA